MVDEIEEVEPDIAEPEVDAPDDEIDAEPDGTALDNLLEALAQEDGDLAAAVQSVEEAGVEETALDQIGQALTDPDTPLEVRLRAVSALNLLGRKEAIPVLGRALQEDEDIRVRRLALATLERLDPANSVLFFQNALQNTKLKDAAIISLGIGVRQLIQRIQDSAEGQANAEKAMLRQIEVANLAKVLEQETPGDTGEGMTVREAAAEALGLFGEEAIQPLCSYLHRTQQAQIQADSVPAGDAVADSLQVDLLRNRVMLSVVTALRTIGTAEVCPCLGEALQDNLNPRIRLLAATSLGRLEQDQAIPYLAAAFLEDPAPDVRRAAGEALRAYGNWQKKMEEAIEVLRQGRLQRGQVDSLSLVKAIAPPPAELEADPNLFTDSLIKEALDNSGDKRLLALLAGLVVASAASRAVVAERLTAYAQRPGVTDEMLQPLRLEIGSAEVLAPLTERLEKDLEVYFQVPIKKLNDDTVREWRRTVQAAFWGFGLRALLSVLLFGIGAFLTIDSYLKITSGVLPLEDFAGPGVSFIAGLGSMAATVFYGPLREIRKAVGDLGAANSAFIHFLHRTSQISHTFSYYYLRGKITFDEAEKAGKQIEEALDKTVAVLKGDDKGAAGTPQNDPQN